VKVFTPLDLEKPNYNLSFYAKFGLVASGTAELELSLLEVPHVVFIGLILLPIGWARGW
jgi:hypothetical protein